MWSLFKRKPKRVMVLEITVHRTVTVEKSVPASPVSPNESQFVSKFYQMNPETDQLLSSGRKLSEGMVVLIEDSIIREDVSSMGDNQYAIERALECNRWCTVTELKTSYRDGSLIRFVAVYKDGSKKLRQYNESYAWLVKLDSIPQPVETEAEPALV